MLKQSLTVVAASILLAACSTPAPPPEIKTPDQLAREHFVRASMTALVPIGREANREWQTGSLEVLYTLDRKNQMLSCKARPVSNPKNSGGLPFSLQLAERMNGLCWQTILPPIPPQLLDPEPTTDLIAPLLFDEQEVSADNQAMWAAIHQRNAYFWRHLFADRPVDSIGIASFIGTLDESRNVLSCEAIIEPHPLRRRDFKQDNSLLDHLEQACAALRNVPLVPGQKPNAQGQYVFIVNLDYSPWRHKADDSHKQ